MPYLILILVLTLGGVGYGGYAYVSNMQEKIDTLRENNAKLEVAIETSEQSLDMMQENMQRITQANQQLQSQLQQAEQYGDELQSKLRKHNLTALALRKPKLLEGKMNGATANLWRDLEKDTGGDGDTPTPHWLQSDADTGTGSESGDEVGESADSNGTVSETSPVN